MIAFPSQLSNRLGEKRARVSVEEEGECRPVCKQLREFIKRYSYNLRALAGGSGGKSFAWLKKASSPKV